MTKTPTRWLVTAAFATIYLVWGSSYIAIHFAIETLPPLLMTASRFLAGGVILIAWAKVRGAPLPTRAQWRAAAIVGFFLFMVNNGSIVWAEGHGVPTGIVAVLVATLPMWIVLLTWFKPGGKVPGALVIAGLILGFVGIILLGQPGAGYAQSGGRGRRADRGVWRGHTDRCTPAARRCRSRRRCQPGCSFCAAGCSNWL